jgi:hypothetical protein
MTRDLLKLELIVSVDRDNGFGTIHRSNSGKPVKSQNSCSVMAIVCPMIIPSGLMRDSGSREIISQVCAALVRQIPDSSSMVIDRLTKETSSAGMEAVLYYYFDHNVQKSQTLDKVAASLLKQLLIATRYVPKDVETFYEDCMACSASGDFESILGLFNSLLARRSKVFLILDALDEFQHTKKLTSLLRHLQSSTAACVKIFCTTRPHLSYLAGELLSLTTVTIKPNYDDIESYITMRLDSDEWQCNDALKPRVVRALMEQEDIGYRNPSKSQNAYHPF